jgi:hypothetical protein
MGGGLLPVAMYKGKLHFLFGLENDNDDHPGWADFGGGAKGSETHFETAVREGTEELNGFYGTQMQMKSTMRKMKLATVSLPTYKTYVFATTYDKSLPCYFNNNFNFTLQQQRLKGVVDAKYNGLFEKQRIKWFSEDEIKTELNFRPFYKLIVAKLVPMFTDIRKRLYKYNQLIKNRNTKKNMTIKKQRGKSFISPSSEKCNPGVCHGIKAKTRKVKTILYTPYVKRGKKDTLMV